MKLGWRMRMLENENFCELKNCIAGITIMQQQRTTSVSTMMSAVVK